MIVNSLLYENMPILLLFLKVFAHISYFLLFAFILLLNFITVDKKLNNKKQSNIQTIITKLNILMFSLYAIVLFICTVFFIIDFND